MSWTFANSQTIVHIWNGADTASGASHTVRNQLQRQPRAQRVDDLRFQRHVERNELIAGPDLYEELSATARR